MSKAHSYLWTASKYISSNYLMTLRSTKHLRQSILPKDTNTLALVGLELTVKRTWVLHCSTRPHALFFFWVRCYRILQVGWNFDVSSARIGRMSRPTLGKHQYYASALFCHNSLPKCWVWFIYCWDLLEIQQSYHKIYNGTILLISNNSMYSIILGILAVGLVCFLFR